MYQCPPRFERVLTRRALGVHHSSVHGRRLPNRTCDHCGEEFRSRYKKEDHIVPVRAFVETPVTAEPDAHYPDNLVCLCPSCHRNAEFGNVVPACLRAATPSAAAF